MPNAAQPGPSVVGVACGYPGCGEPVWPGSAGGLCLVHAAENGAEAESARRVWRKARQALSAGEAGHFAGWHFPLDPDGTGFAAQVFEHGANFNNAVFHGAVQFRGAHFRDVTIFDGAQFLGEVNFESARFDAGGLAAFDGVAFTGRANFVQTGFSGEAWFIGATFAGSADFQSARFDSNAVFNGAVFRGNASFSYVRFRSVVQFHRAVFHGHALFSVRGNELPTEVELDLPNLQVPWRGATPFALREQGEHAYRLAKQSAQNGGDYRRAGNYHYAEQCAIQYGKQKGAGLRFWKPAFWLCWLEFLFARGLLGYGEKPARVLLAGLVVIVLWAGLFLTFGGVAPADAVGPAETRYHPDFNECLHFSAVTFTTVGYGDYRPKPNCRLLADCEAFGGAALMAMFVVALTRKYMR